MNRRCALALPLAAALLGCGARTGLLQPCEAEMVRVKPGVVLLLDHSSAMTSRNERGEVHATRLMNLVETAIPPLEDEALVAMVTHPILTIFADQLGGDLCIPANRLDNAFGSRTRDIVTTYRTGNNGLGPTGAPSILRTLPLVERSLRGLAAPGRELFIVLAMLEAACPASRDDPTTSQDVIGRSQVAAITRLRERGIGTLLLGFSYRRTSSAIRILQHLADMAHAGGLPRTAVRALSIPTRPEEFPFIDAIVAEQFTAAVRTHFRASYWCRGTIDLPEPDRIELRTDGGEVIPRDPTGRDGWSWEDLSVRRVRIHGPACERLIDARTVVRARLPERVCLQ